MYKEHSIFAPPTPDATLWRYLTFTKFVSLLDKRAIFFTRADKLGDPFEGAVARINLELQRRHWEANISNLKQYAIQLPDMSERPEVAVKEIRRHTLINCWYESEHESEAMWNLYSRAHEGIAIRTDFRSLADSFKDDRDIFIGRVSYIDYEKDSMQDDNLFRPFLYKRKGFEHEREVRALTIALPSHIGPSKGPLDMSQAIYSVGTYCKVDLSQLVSEVVVAPYAPEWLLELTESVASRYDLQATVVRSSLAIEPAWR